MLAKMKVPLWFGESGLVKMADCHQCGAFFRFVKGSKRNRRFLTCEPVKALLIARLAIRERKRFLHADERA